MAAPPPPTPFDQSIIVDDAVLHDSRQAGVNAAAWVCTSVAICTVAMKLFTKARIVRMVGWDDFIILLSLTLSIIAASLVSSSVTLGLGRHTEAVLAEPDGLQRLQNTTSKLRVGYVLHIGAFSLPNIAIALLVVQLLDRNVWRTRALYALVGVQAAAAAASMAMVLAHCGAGAAAPVAACRDPALFKGLSYFVAVFTALTDAVLAAVPVAAFWRLQMPARTKLGLCLLMGLTLLSALVTVVKAFYLHLFTDVGDPLWNVVPLVVWSLIEQNVVIVAACIPTLRPFFTKGGLLPLHLSHHLHHHHQTPSTKGPSPPREPGGLASWLGSWKMPKPMKTKSGHRPLFTGDRRPRRPRTASSTGSSPPNAEVSTSWLGSWKVAKVMKTTSDHRSLFTGDRMTWRPRTASSTSSPSPHPSGATSWLGAWKASNPMKTTSEHRRLFTGDRLPWRPRTPSSQGSSPSRPGGSASWLGAWKVPNPTKTKTNQRPLFTGDRRPWRPRATSDAVPLHHVARGRSGDRRRSEAPDAAPPAVQDPAAPDDDDYAASRKVFVHTFAVTLDWDARRPPSVHSAKTDWLGPPTPQPATAGAERGFHAP